MSAIHSGGPTFYRLRRTWMVTLVALGSAMGVVGQNQYLASHAVISGELSPALDVKASTAGDANRVGSIAVPTSPAGSTPLFDLEENNVKFRIDAMMRVLRDSKHEGWVLAAYPDPKTSRPLIGAGFGLDVRETPHPQLDPMNAHQFLEPSSAELWQAAGLDPQRLESILERYDEELSAWRKKNFRRKIKAHRLSPQITEPEADQLLRISAMQAVNNAAAYCRNFDQLTASQQMALSQLVFQMGVNLEEFVQFLSVLNDDLSFANSAGFTAGQEDREHWKTVQRTLIESDWARRYTTRAVTVIAMFDPDYDKNPAAAEYRVQQAIHPLVVHHRKKPRVQSVSASNTHRKSGHRKS